MEVTVLDAGDLPLNTVISFSNGSVCRHMQIEQGKPIHLPYLSGPEQPVRIDLMTPVGSCAFDAVPDQELYDIHMGQNGSVERPHLTLQIRLSEAAQGGCSEDRAYPSQSPGSPSRKIQMARTVRSFLDQHDILGHMQGLLHELGTSRPEDPIEFMVRRLDSLPNGMEAARQFSPDHKQTGRESLNSTGRESLNSSSPDSEVAPLLSMQCVSAQPAAQGQGGSPGSPLSGASREQPATRREGVSAEPMGDGRANNWTPPVYEKYPAERQQLSDMIRTSRDGKLRVLFGSVNNETFEKIVDAMSLKVVAMHENVIEQGGVGDFFYIVKSGEFDISVKRGQDPPKKVFHAGVGFAFGELALLYNAPRSATITACVKSEVWSLDRTAFRNLLVSSAEMQFRARLEFLKSVDLLQVLDETECAALAEVLQEEEFEDDEAIVEQGERDDKMFIVQTGSAVACIKGEQGEVEVMNYMAGSYFGEIALLSGKPRLASVYAIGSCTCIYITRQTFMRILGPLTSRLQQHIDKYEKYQDAIATAVDMECDEPAALPCDGTSPTGALQPDDDLEGDMEPSLTRCRKSKIVHRKRERLSPIENLALKKNVQQETQTPVKTLAEKVVRDFENALLVQPTSEFVVEESHMSLFAGLTFAQAFCDDARVHVRSDTERTRISEDHTYFWQGPTKLRAATNISVVCQKGNKSASDPTPNQDNFFVYDIDGVMLFGVVDGHGPFGHLVSFRLVQSLPHFIAKSKYFGRNWELALKDAFARANEELCRFSSVQSINLEASGAACSVVLMEEQTVHVAFVGDARVMLGSWNRRDSRMLLCTEGHKPSLPTERARLEASGSEVRELDPGNSRIYLPGSSFPGLTMSRAFGDTACKGVLADPEYHRLLMQPDDQWYCIVATDGIWEFMEGQEVCNMTSKKLRLKGPRETLHFLTGASRRRWSHCCGDYCDDITGILVQWNASESKDSKLNHSVTVAQP